MRILFVFAHPDDEAFGPAGTIAKLAGGNRVSVITLCNGTRPREPLGAGDVRRDAFDKSCARLGVVNWHVFDGMDTKLGYDYAKEKVEMTVNNLQPEIVYTHNISDIHRDHRIVAEVTMIACRPKVESYVDELYMCEIPAATDWAFNQIGGELFVPNTYVNIDKEFDVKQEVLSYYETELHEYPDARSIEAMGTLACYRGYQIGVERAEAFKQVFRRR